MSDFKIIGNPNPVVGVVEFYSVNTFFQKILPFQDLANFNKSPEPMVQWEVHVLELGKWRKANGNEKTGNQVTFKFRHSSLDRKGIRILARKGEEVARFDIKPISAERAKIDDVQLLNKNGEKIVGRLSYGQTVKARVHCLHMEEQRVYVTLWEDDVKGAGHDKANEKNFIETRSGIVRSGKADIDFLLKPSFAKIATKYGPEKDNVHEYYVTADQNNEKIASNNINVDALEAPVKPYKGKTTPKQPAKINKPVEQSKTNASETSKAVKGKINSVNITDTAGHQIKGVFKEKQIKVWINSVGLIGKNVLLKLYDEDVFGNDLLFYQEFTIQSDLHAIVVSLNTIPRSLGGNYLSEGAEQELFAEVEVLQNHAFAKSTVLDVDATVFKQDPIEVSNKVMKVGVTDREENKEKNKCYCNKDFEEKDVRKLVKLLKGTETIWEGVALKGGKRAECNISDKTFATLTKALNDSFKKYNINTCAQKMHFLAQVCEETGAFALSEETKGQHASSNSIYKGRGLLQLTGVKGDNVEFYNSPGPYKDYADHKGDPNIVKNPIIVANNVDYCIESGAWIWSLNKKMPKAPSGAVDRWGVETSGKSLNELAIYVDKYLELISVLLNGRGSNGMPNNYEKRVNNYHLLKTAFFKYSWYHLDKSKTIDTKDIVTYHIYSYGIIEKHVPKQIKSEYEESYKYVYHDTNDNEHEVCISEWHKTKEKANGKNKGTVKPTHSKIVYDEMVNEGQTERRIKYENGDIAEYGANKGKYFWNLYEALDGEIELVRMPDYLSIKEIGVIYSFSDTQRRYTCPSAFAGFIGALAECKLPMVKTTGSCFSDATCFPSVSHVNGKSIDTQYLDKTSETKFIKAMNKFHFNFQITGTDGTHTYDNTTHKSDHNDHLHSGFRESEIITIYEK